MILASKRSMTDITEKSFCLAVDQNVPFQLELWCELLVTICKKLDEDVFSQIYWITWNLALKWSFAGVRVFMLPEMEMFFFLQFIDRNWLIVRYARIQRWSLHNIVAFSCRMHKSHVTRHSIFATCNLTAAAFHYKCFQRFSKSNLQFCANFTLQYIVWQTKCANCSKWRNACLTQWMAQRYRFTFCRKLTVPSHTIQLTTWKIIIVRLWKGGGWCPHLTAQAICKLRGT